MFSFFNWHGFLTLFYKETWRFIKVSMQTILAPTITVLLYLVVFASVLSERVEVYPGVPYTSFLIPGLIMMAILQNAFSNTSSSLFQSKQNGNILFTLLSPISSLEFYLAYVAASLVRGIMVGSCVWLVNLFFFDIPMAYPLFVILFAVFGSLLLGALGLIASIYADKWDHLSTFQNFVILPLSFLSGVFYSINDLPGIWSQLSWYNPFFYIIDGFRYGFLGISDANASISLVVVVCFFLFISALNIWMLKTGYKLRE